MCRIYLDKYVQNLHFLWFLITILDIRLFGSNYAFLPCDYTFLFQRVGRHDYCTSSDDI